MKAAIVTIGDEILIGQIVDTNSGFIAKALDKIGVAVHEMALSGLPLVLSNKVGAASMFLNENNGFSFPAGNQVTLEEILIKIMNMDDAELNNMSIESIKSGRQLLSDDWSRTLLKIYNS